MLMASLASVLVVNELRAPTNPKASAAIGMNLLNFFIVKIFKIIGLLYLQVFDLIPDN